MTLEFPDGDQEAELDNKSPDAFRTISEVAEDLDIPQHVLRFWETRFTRSSRSSAAAAGAITAPMTSPC